MWKNWKKPKTKVRKLIGLGATNGETQEKVIGEYPKAQYYTKPLETPTGIPKG